MVVLVAAGMVLAGCQTDGSNDPLKMLLLGPMAVQPQQPARPAATAGRYDTAVRELTDRLLEGQGVAPDSYAAISLLEQQARAGNPTSPMYLTNLYTGMAGVRRDPAKSAYWAKRAAEAGNLDGQATYGLYLSAGFGVEKNEAEGVQWLRRAADARFSMAMRLLGEAYLDGVGVPVDKAAAYAWFTLAEMNAKADDTRYRAIRARQSAALLMLPSEIEIAQALADQWRPGRDVTGSPRVAGVTRANAEYRVADASGTVPASGSNTVLEDVPTEVTRLYLDFDVNADGSFALTFEGTYLAKNASSAHEIGQLPFTYQNKMETFEILEAYTLKSDGRRLPVAPSAILTQAGPNSGVAPMFGDESQKVIIYPSLEAGDSVYFRVKYVQKPYFPGHFTYSRFFERDRVIRDARIRITAPEAMGLRTETHELKSTRKVESGRVIHEWRWQNLQAQERREPVLDGFDRAPRLYVSSFKSHGDIGRFYAEMARENTAVTPAVTALADEITAGMTDRRQQAEAIYDWVRQRIRYVQIRLGTVGTYVPHSVDSIITNRYGDCKDHAALFSALLAAKGIASETVLINSGNSYTLGGVPALASLNHAITWLPDFNLYADTTAGVAPFGVLPFDQYGKPVVHASLSNPRVARTPVLGPDVATISTRVTAKFNADGRFSGDSDTTATGPYAVWMRQQAVQIQSMGAEQAGKENLKFYGFDGSARYQVDDVYRSTPSYRVTGRFQTLPRRDLLSGNSFRPQALLTVAATPADQLLGPLDFVDPQGQHPTPCFSGKQQQEISIELPPGKRLRQLPKSTEIKNKYASYRSNWSQSGKTVTVRREFRSEVKESVCVGDARRQIGKMLDDIRADYYSALALAEE